MKFRLSQFLFGKRKEEPKSDIQVQFVQTIVVTMKGGAYYRLQECDMKEEADRYIVTYLNSPVKHTLYKSDISVLSEGLMYPKISQKEKQ